MFGLDRVIIYIVGAILLAVASTTSYYVWKHNVELAAITEFNNRQLEQNVRDQAAFIKRQEELAAEQRRIAAALVEQNRALQARVNGVNQMLNQAVDSPAPDIVRRTIDSLRGTTR